VELEQGARQRLAELVSAPVQGQAVERAEPDRRASAQEPEQGQDREALASLCR
jgi:hypothetical protein